MRLLLLGWHGLCAILSLMPSHLIHFHAIICQPKGSKLVGYTTACADETVDACSFIFAM